MQLHSVKLGFELLCCSESQLSKRRKGIVQGHLYSIKQKLAIFNLVYFNPLKRTYVWAEDLTIQEF